MYKCPLCLNKTEVIRESHIYPKFIVKWIKDTSITGYVRDMYNINKRVQDGEKMPMLCPSCESILSKYESTFNLNIFIPFTRRYIDNFGHIFKDGYFHYESWLLKFVISINWRLFQGNSFIGYPSKDMPNKYFDIINDTIECWRKYLLGEVSYTGNNSSYLLFLRNIYFGEGTLPPNISPHINHYLLRTTDGALLYNKKYLLVYSKIGPIAFITSLSPAKIIGYPDSRIKEKGHIKIEQRWSNLDINNYIFIERPNEIDKFRDKSSKQNLIVERDYKRNIHKLETTLTMNVNYTDYLIDKEINKK